jgi:hypothetical protein
MVTTQHYAEIRDVALDDGFSRSPFGNSAPAIEVCLSNDDLPNEVQKVDNQFSV